MTSRQTRPLLTLRQQIWGTGKLPIRSTSQNPFQTPSGQTSAVQSGYATPLPIDEKSGGEITAEGVDEEFDEKEKDISRPESLGRPVMRTSALFIGLAMATTFCLLFGVYIGKLIGECFLDGTWTRMALVAPIPLLICVSIFFFQIVFSDLFQLIGPIGGYQTNSRFYSCHKPSIRRAEQAGLELPKITIQMPVYKESLDSVIIPTIRSLQQAVSYYESRGGTANIYINDDGQRAGLSEAEVKKRQDYYHDNNIGWVARPRHKGDEGFIRKGKFKKASNMNFALNVSQKLESRMQGMMDERILATGTDFLDDNEEEEMYGEALEQVLRENPLAWAQGDIRVGEVILLVDCDTRVVSTIVLDLMVS
jgi:hypothetical protein